MKNGWAGILGNGCIRDSKAIGDGPRRLRPGTHPKKTVKRNVGEVDVPVSFGGVTFQPGHHVYADETAWS